MDKALKVKAYDILMRTLPRPLARLVAKKVTAWVFKELVEELVKAGDTGAAYSTVAAYNASFPSAPITAESIRKSIESLGPVLFIDPVLEMIFIRRFQMEKQDKVDHLLQPEGA